MVSALDSGLSILGLTLARITALCSCRAVLSVESNLRLLWFCITTLSDWFKNLAPLSRPIIHTYIHALFNVEKKPKPIVTRSRTFSRATRQLHVFASSFDWFTGLSMSFLIGQSNYFSFGFTTLN